MVADVDEQDGKAVAVEHAGREEEDRVVPAAALAVDEDHGGRIGPVAGHPPGREVDAVAALEADVLVVGHRIWRRVEAARREVVGDSRPSRTMPACTR